MCVLVVLRKNTYDAGIVVKVPKSKDIIRY